MCIGCIVHTRILQMRLSRNLVYMNLRFAQCNPQSACTKHESTVCTTKSTDGPNLNCAHNIYIHLHTFTCACALDKCAVLSRLYQIGGVERSLQLEFLVESDLFHFSHLVCCEMHHKPHSSVCMVLLVVTGVG